MIATKQGNRLTELDVLRGLAAVGVLLFHYTVFYDRLFHHDKSVPLFQSGAHAVNLFFIISGFVIYMTLAKTKKPMDFVVSRFSRLYPAYWCAALVTFVIVRTCGLPELQVGVKELLVNLTMLQRYFGVKHVDSSYWTLTYELGFYVMMLGLFCLKWLKRPLLISAAFLTFQSAVIILVMAKVLVVPSVVGKILLLSYGHQFACGIVFYQIYKGVRNYWVHLIPLWALANEYFMPKMLYGQIDPSAPVMLLFVAVFYLFVFGRLKWICWGGLAFLGSISYTLYLIHQRIGYVVIQNGYSQGFNPFVSIGLAICVAIGLAVAITYIVEKPSLRLLRNWYRKRTELREIRPRPAVVEPVTTNISES
jgi:peptidoglycan/LPS O-acetylase OafA/YrhL